jgi:hypothetical protein
MSKRFAVPGNLATWIIAVATAALAVLAFIEQIRKAS